MNISNQPPPKKKEKGPLEQKKIKKGRVFRRVICRPFGMSNQVMFSLFKALLTYFLLAQMLRQPGSFGMSALVGAGTG